MENNDTIHLLKECDAGSKMAVSSIDEVLERIQDSHLKQLLEKSKEHHEQLGNEIHSQLLKHQSDEKDPNPMAKGMSWLKTNARLAFKPGDASVADLVVSGCNMGIKNLHKYQNQYASADEPSKNVADELIGLEADLANSLYPYL